MIVVFVILGAVCGLLAGTSTLYAGGTLMDSIFAYTGMGSTTTLLSCTAYFLSDKTRDNAQRQGV
ncbi:hypothetical protein I5535_00085 [Rhodobacteraceae bacterium F11138]|nr:hypothetical protein [Rhodobacteraceae bacterium F11138]